MGYSSYRNGTAVDSDTQATAALPEGLEFLLLSSSGLIEAPHSHPERQAPGWHVDNYVATLARKLIDMVADGVELESHCHRLALLSSLVGVEMELGADDLRSLRRGAYLHDIGKIGIPHSILLKQGRLDENEWRLMQQHPIIGEQICRDLPSLKAILPIIRSHHERWDGTGYPDGLRGEGIPLLARITQMADIYDALTTERPYKAAFTPEQALEIIKEEGQRGWRDPQLVEIVESLFPIFKPLPADTAASFSLKALSDVVKRRSWQ